MMPQNAIILSKSKISAFSLLMNVDDKMFRNSFVITCDATKLLLSFHVFRNKARVLISTFCGGVLKKCVIGEAVRAN